MPRPLESTDFTLDMQFMWRLLRRLRKQPTSKKRLEIAAHVQRVIGDLERLATEEANAGDTDEVD